MSGGRDVVGGVVGQCSGALKSVGEVCTSTPECDSDMYCSYGENDLQDNGEVGRCCAEGQYWVPALRGNGGICRQADIGIPCTCGFTPTQLSSNGFAQAFRGWLAAFGPPSALAGRSPQWVTFENIRPFFYKTEGNKPGINIECIDTTRKRACIEIDSFGVTGKYWQHYEVS